ncbi:MAG: translation initiation factor IF-2 [Clostridiales bacterium]|nr:translation initiation factor IF-2 [Clostridiales bacterium]
MKQSFLDTAKQLETGAAEFIAGAAGKREEIAGILSRARGAEDNLREKETRERRERMEREREERLRQLLASDETGAAHAGGTEDVGVDSIRLPESESGSEPAPTPEPPPAPTPEPAPDLPAPEMQAPAEPETPAPAAGTDTVRPPKPAKADKPARPSTERVYVAPAQQSRPPRQDKPPRAQTGPAPTRPPRVDRPGQAIDTGRPPQRDTAPRPAQPRSATSSPYSSYDPNAPRRQDGSAPRPGAPTRPGTPARPDGTRPAGAPKPTERAVSFPNANAPARRGDGAKPSYDRDKKATKNKKTLEREAGPSARAWDEDSATGSRKIKRGKAQQLARPEPVVIEHAIISSETISVRDFSEKIGKPAADIIKKLFLVGIVANVNQEIDFDTCELIAADFNITLEKQIAKTFEEVLADDAEETDDPKSLRSRPPVVTIMGHVDHGKTSLLDAIRQSNVATGEAGGITQHIGAYTVTLREKQITFVDTPGHEAFTSMRARGAQVTDIVILVVAADDGIMPQTVEAINHAKAAKVPIIVAINKIDKDGADPSRVKQQLTEHELVSEEWGGDTICVEVSAKQRLNLDNLLEMILLQAEVLELVANPNRRAKGTILEAKLDKARGPVATVLVQNGTLKRGDTIVAGTAYGRIRAMVDDKGRSIVAAGPSTPVEVLGLGEVPEAGDIMNAVDADKLSRQVAEERRDKIKAAQVHVAQKVTLDDLFSQMAQGELKDLNIIVKADVQGSVEAVKQALEKLSNEEVRVRCIHGGVGAITGSDIMFASASNAIVIGFNVRPDTTAKASMEKEKVDVRLYNVIYAAIEDVEKAMKGLFKPVFREVEMGRISVRNTFKVSGVGTIAGAYVQDGKVTRAAQVRVIRDSIVLHTGKIASLRRFKDDVREVLSGYECGIGIENFNDIREGDVIEAFTIEEVER